MCVLIFRMFHFVAIYSHRIKSNKKADFQNLLLYSLPRSTFMYFQHIKVKDTSILGVVIDVPIETNIL